MTRTALSLTFAAGFVAALVCTMPMRVALAWAGARDTGFSARAISGSIWDAWLDGTQFQGLGFGTVNARLDAISVLAGAPRLSVQSAAGRLTLVVGRMHGLDRANVAFDVSALGLAIPAAGTVRLQDAALLFAQGQCREARGRIVTDMLQRNFSGPELAGNLVCAGDNAIVRLRGENSELQALVEVTLAAGGHYRMRSEVTSSTPSLRMALVLAGFHESGDGMMRIDEGVLGS